MNFERGYMVDTHERFLLIPILKCGSRSIMSSAKPLRINIDRADAIQYNHLPTIAVIRHPWDRLVSAMYSVLRDARPFAERLEDHVFKEHPLEINSHVRPQWFWLRDFRIDYWVRFDKLHEDWAKVQEVFPHFKDLKHLHKGRARPVRWQDEPYDWSNVLHVFQKDFELCPDWSA